MVFTSAKGNVRSVLKADFGQSTLYLLGAGRLIEAGNKAITGH